MKVFELSLMKKACMKNISTVSTRLLPDIFILNEYITLYSFPRLHGNMLLSIQEGQNGAVASAS